jgi:hypothetical protein
LTLRNTINAPMTTLTRELTQMGMLAVNFGITI